jgi:hypothetical protein
MSGSVSHFNGDNFLYLYTFETYELTIASALIANRVFRARIYPLSGTILKCSPLVEKIYDTKPSTISLTPSMLLIIIPLKGETKPDYFISIVHYLVW